MLKNWNLEYMKIEFKNLLEKAWKKKKKEDQSVRHTFVLKEKVKNRRNICFLSQTQAETMSPEGRITSVSPSHLNTYRTLHCLPK